MESQPVSTYACDACKQRKVKCNRQVKCNQCTHLNLRCHYSTANPSSRSRKYIVRGAVIESYREPSRGQKRALRSSSSVLPALAFKNDPVLTEVPVFTANFFSNLLQDYATFVLPFLPIVPESEFASAISDVGTDSASCALVDALGAITLNMTTPAPGEQEVNANNIKVLCNRALQKRGPLMPDHQFTVANITIPLIVATCLYAVNRSSNMAFYYLREASIGVQILQRHDFRSQVSPHVSDQAQYERLYWVLFVHERLQSINYCRRPILSVLHSLMQPDPTISPRVIDGFNHIIRLFQLIDDTFLANWIDKQSATLTLTWIEAKQSQLGHENDDWEEIEIKDLSQMQRIDLIITRDWHRIMVWQMALSKFFLTMDRNPERQFLEIIFPARVSHRLVKILREMPREAIEVHGTGILHKIFDITSSFADVLEHSPSTTCNKRDLTERLEDFYFLVSFLETMSRFYHFTRTVLQSRFETLCEVYPQLKEMVARDRVVLPADIR